MPPPNQPNPAERAPLDELLAVVLRQFRRPLAAQGVTLSDAASEALAGRIARREPPDAEALAVREALIALVTESEAVLAGWGLTFVEALDTPMGAIGGWETTSDFLEVAANKSNAELRIAAGSSLVLALGDARYAANVQALAARTDEATDLDAAVARRVLAHVGAG